MQSSVIANFIPIKDLPEWICNLTDIGELLHTGSRKSTRATELTETLYKSGTSGEWKAKENQ